MAVSGGAAGSAFGKGHVYIMHSPKEKNGDKAAIKIGCAKGDPETTRLPKISKQVSDVELIYTSSEANEMNGAETAAQKAVKKHHQMTKIGRNASDWFWNPSWTTLTDLRKDAIIETVKAAVKQHNKCQ